MNDLLSNRDRMVNQEITLSREQGYFDKSKGVRLLVAVFFALSASLFLHFREISVEVLELDSEAERYVVSQVDFAFYDEEATTILKQQAVADIDSIYKIHEKDVRQARSQFEQYLINNPSWRKQAEHTTFDEVYKAADLLEDALLHIRFTNTRSFHKMQEVSLPLSNYRVLAISPSFEKIKLPKEVWDHVALLAFARSKFREGTVELLNEYFKNISWRMSEDEGAWKALRQLVELQVPRKYTKVSAGDRIIDQGELVTTKHLSMMQAMKKSMSAIRNPWHPLTLFGTAVITGLALFVAAAYLQSFHPEILSSNKKLFLLATVMVLSLFLAKVTEFLLLRTATKMIEFVRFPVLLPFPAILLTSLMNSRLAIFASGFLVVAMTTTLAVQQKGFLVVNLLSAIVAILSTRSLRRRKEVFVVCGKAWICCAVLVLGFHCYDNTLWGVSFFADLLTSLLFMGVTGILIVGLLPLLEAGFHLMTDVTLMEYMDPNHHLLRRLAIEAPGTYQHSVVVGSLSEAAAVAIGGNGLFCRVSTLYHDIGKLVNPHYFTENQQGGVNIHQLLTPLESAQVIISHVSEGVAMARKAGLPEQFIDIIKEHHGTTLVYYFYAKQLELAGGDESQVDQRDFRYMGPKPRRKESAIIMIADSLEAASRSLDEINEKSVAEILDNIVKEKIEDGQFDRSLLTFEELELAKKAMVKTLVAVGHSRVKYPRQKKEESRISAESKAG